MIDRSIINFNNLPPELKIEIFSYFNQVDLLYSFYDLNSTLNAILSGCVKVINLSTASLDFIEKYSKCLSVLKSNVDQFIFEKTRTNNIIKKLFNDKCSLTNCSLIKSSYIFGGLYIDNMSKNYSICELSIPLNTPNDLFIIFVNMPFIQKLNIQLCYYSSVPLPNIDLQTKGQYLEYFILNVDTSMLTFDQFQLIMNNLNSLKYLTYNYNGGTQNGQDYIDGEKWQKLLENLLALEQFQFDLKWYIRILFCSILQKCFIYGQFLTPDQLYIEQQRAYDSRTHYEYTGIRTDLFRRVNPDYLLRGFFPFWSIVLICFALLFLLVALIGVIGYLCGCRRPKPEYYKDFEQLQQDDDYLINENGVYRKGDVSELDEDFKDRLRLQESLDRGRLTNEDMV
ncbi:unnamed protein product [Didymodactylos carnosus]|uniref:F-box domain-containing protein n=1 Tax=Didymodactylos carnosus TaxID=1234261 RepID=A0A813PCJ4_9BILA|nr:unnamed protein product [Didymodactylos carnosus]CAF3530371.1 unnamed protein product [Didymodactylos carnosus]